MEYFYTQFAESAKFLLYVVFLLMIAIGLWKRRQGIAGWASWIHATVFLNSSSVDCTAVCGC